MAKIILEPLDKQDPIFKQGFLTYSLPPSLLTLNFGVPNKLQDIEEIYKKSLEGDLSAKDYFDKFYKIREKELSELIVNKDNSNKSLLQEAIEFIVQKKLTKINFQIGMSTYKNILLPTISILYKNSFFQIEGDFLEILTEEKRKELMSMFSKELNSSWVFVSIFS